MITMLELTRENIEYWSIEYDKKYRGTKDETTEIKLKKVLENQRYLEKQDFIELYNWKTARQTKNYQKNDAVIVKKVTTISFSTTNEKERVNTLIKLSGVKWAVGSAILHFAFPNLYSILDFRAIWSLGWEQPKSYNYIFWQKYHKRIRAISQQVNLPIRTIDKALWKFSKQNQKSSCKKGKT
jgi:hypothetical protein